MRKKRSDYLVAANDLTFTHGNFSVKMLAKRAKSSYDSAYYMARQLELSVLSKSERMRERYRDAVQRARAADPDGIVTFESVALELDFNRASVTNYFRNHAGLAEEWSVVCENEATKRRLRIAADRFRKKYPGMSLYRKLLAFEAKMTDDVVTSFLHRQKNRHLVAELGVVYTRPGETGRKKRG